MYPVFIYSLDSNTTKISEDSPHLWDNSSLIIYCLFLIVRPSLMTFLTSLIAPKILLLFPKSSDLYQFFIEFVFLVITEVCFLTVFSKLSLFVEILVILIWIYFLYYSYYFPYNLHLDKLLNVTINDVHRSYITKTKAMTNFITSIAILAVDFHIFPLHMGKTEEFGYSLMDTGVGFFVIINGITSFETRANYQPNFIKANIHSLISCIPLLVIGLLRAISVYLLDYSVNIHEYGQHWNFFLTLSCVKLIGTLLLSIIHPKFAALLSIIVILIHEYTLQQGLLEWIFSNSPRNNFISSNREGIISTTGYIAIYLMSVAYGRFIKCKGETLLKNMYLLYKQITVNIGFWSLVFLTVNIFQSSRRAANLGYFLWMNALCYTIMTLMFIIELILIGTNLSLLQQEKTHSHTPTIITPIIHEAINFNGLAFFLVANLLTGFVNMSISTKNCNSLTSLLILFTYMFINCLIVFWLYKKKIRIKFTF